jgi:hypothetical protein
MLRRLLLVGGRMEEKSGFVGFSIMKFNWKFVVCVRDELQSLSGLMHAQLFINWTSFCGKL